MNAQPRSIVAASLLKHTRLPPMDWRTRIFYVSICAPSKERTLSLPCPSFSNGGRSSVLDGLPIVLEIQYSKASGRVATPKVHLPVHAVSSSPDTQWPGRSFECKSIQL